jgi:hypothetical protein
MPGEEGLERVVFTVAEPFHELFVRRAPHPLPQVRATPESVSSARSSSCPRTQAREHIGEIQPEGRTEGRQAQAW